MGDVGVDAIFVRGIIGLYFVVGEVGLSVLVNGWLISYCGNLVHEFWDLIR